MARRHKPKRRPRPHAPPAPAPSGAQRIPAADSLERFRTPILVLVGLVVAAVYTSTLYPSVPGGDSGELIVAADRLGVAHPPGYPLFTMLGKVFTLLPLGTIAWRVNLLTALAGAAAATVLVRAVWRLGASFAAGIFAGGLFAFSPLVWRYAVQTEVFSLNNLFVALLLLLLVAHEADRRPRTVPLFFFVFGLGLTNHHTLIFVGAPLGLWMLYRSGAISRPRRLATLAACFALGLTPYLYLFLAPADHPSATWGDTSSLSGFFEHLLRRQYGTLRLGTMEAGGTLAGRMGAWLAHLPGQMLWVGILPALVGIALPFVKRAGTPRFSRAAPSVALAALVLYLLVFQSLAGISLDDPLWHEVYSRFWQQADLVLFFLAGAGFAWLASRAGRAGRALALPLALIAVAAQAAVHHSGQDHSRDRAVSQLTAAVLHGLPRDAILVTKGDLYWNGVRYHQVCEGLRPDVRLLDVEMLKAPWMTARVERAYPGFDLPGTVYRAPARRVPGSYDLAALFRGAPPGRAVFSNALEHGDTSWAGSFAAWPEGLLDRVLPAGDPVDLERWIADTDRWIREVRVEFREPVPGGSWERIAREQYRLVESRRGAKLLAEAVAGRLDVVGLRKTREILERAAAMRDEPSASLALNLGIANYLLRGKEPGAVEAMVEAWQTYLRVAPPDATQRALVERVLRDPERAEIRLGAR